MSTSTSACDCLVGVPTGPTLASTCGGSAFMLFMGLLEVFIRSQCDLEDPCGRASSRVSQHAAKNEMPLRISNSIVIQCSSARSRTTSTISLSLAAAQLALWWRHVSPRCRSGKCCSLKPVSGIPLILTAAKRSHVALQPSNMLPGCHVARVCIHVASWGCCGQLDARYVAFV